MLPIYMHTYLIYNQQTNMTNTGHMIDKYTQYLPDTWSCRTQHLMDERKMSTVPYAVC